MGSLQAAMAVIASQPVFTGDARAGGQYQAIVPIPAKAAWAIVTIDRTQTVAGDSLSLAFAVTYDGKSWIDMGGCGCAGYDPAYDDAKQVRESGMYVELAFPELATRQLQVTYGQSKQAVAGVKVDFR